LRIFIYLSLVFLSFDILACEEEVSVQNIESSTQLIIHCNLKQQPIEIVIPKEAITVSIPSNDETKKAAWSFREVIYLLTPIIALFALVYTIKSNKMAKLNRLEDQFLSEIDNFWFKEVITPKVLNPIFDYISDQHIKFGKLSPLVDDENIEAASKIEHNIEKLTDATTELQLSLNLLSNIPYGEKYSNSVKDEIDGLEDHLSCFLFAVDESAFDTNDVNTELQAFSSIQDIFSFAQGKILELTKEYRDETKVQMKKHALQNHKST
jgi:hypothetical protein